MQVARNLMDILAKRLEELGLTKYEIAKRIAAKEGKATGQINTRVAQTIDNPEKRVFKNVIDVVHELGGEVVIRWHNTDEHVITHNSEP